jgi:hypothetical protein
MYTEFWWGNLRARDHLEDPGVDGRIIRWVFLDVGEWIVLIWFRLKVCGGHLRMR